MWQSLLMCVSGQLQYCNLKNMVPLQRDVFEPIDKTHQSTNKVNYYSLHILKF